jgi:CheY-like chemotaxis protein
VFRSRQKRRRILIVEDDWAVLEVLKLMLEYEDHVVVVARNGREALAAAAAKPFDLVLMDISMPEMSGIEVARALRALPKTADVLLAIHTGLDEHWVRERFVDYDLFLTKAADTDVLVDEITKLFLEPSERRLRRTVTTTEPDFSVEDVMRAQRALRDAMQLGPDVLSLPDVLGMLALEIEQLRKLGSADHVIAASIADAIGRGVTAAAVAHHLRPK